jgi:hypothetical protein
MIAFSVFGQESQPRRNNQLPALVDARPTAPAPRPRLQPRPRDARERASQVARLLSLSSLLT